MLDINQFVGESITTLISLTIDGTGSQKYIYNTPYSKGESCGGDVDRIYVRNLPYALCKKTCQRKCWIT